MLLSQRSPSYQRASGRPRGGEHARETLGSVLLDLEREGGRQVALEEIGGEPWRVDEFESVALATSRYKRNPSM